MNCKRICATRSAAHPPHQQHNMSQIMKLKSEMTLTLLVKKAVSLALLSFISLLFSGQAQAVVLNVNSSGKLTGAAGVKVGLNYYDVEFLSGTCIQIFSGCDSLDDLFFKDGSLAQAASQALLDQVLIDGSQGLFDSQPTLLPITNSSSIVANIFTPYNVDMSANTVSIRSARNYSGEVADTIVTLNLSRAGPSSSSVYAKWSLATPVPAPLPILGAVAAIGWSRKLRRRIRESQALAS